MTACSLNSSQRGSQLQRKRMCEDDLNFEHDPIIRRHRVLVPSHGRPAQKTSFASTKPMMTEEIVATIPGSMKL